MRMCLPVLSQHHLCMPVSLTQHYIMSKSSWAQFNGPCTFDKMEISFPQYLCTIALDIIMLVHIFFFHIHDLCVPNAFTNLFPNISMVFVCIVVIRTRYLLPSKKI